MSGLRASEIMPLRWSDFDFDDLTLLVQRSMVHGRVARREDGVFQGSRSARSGLSRDSAQAQGTVLPHPEGWLFANPETGRPYHQDTIQQNHIRKRKRCRAWRRDRLAHVPAQLPVLAGRHRSALTVQKELMRHASIQTTMNIYGKAMTDSKRQAHSKVVEMVLKSRKSREAASRKEPVRGYWELMGVFRYRSPSCNR